MSERPRRTNANTHPTQALLKNKQKRRTPAEIAATDEAKAIKEKEEATEAQRNHHAAIARVAELEDAIQREDKAYPVITSSESHAHKLQRASHDSQDNKTDDLVTEGTALKEHVER